MAQINCSECGKKIYDNLIECPYCGCPVKKDDNIPKMIEPTLPWKNKETPTDETKNKLTCKNCGEELNEKFKVCPYCGTKVEKEEAPAKGTEVELALEEDFKDLSSNTSEPKEIEPTDLIVEQAPTPAPKRRGRPPKKKTKPCAECGAEIDINTTACPECGRPVEVEVKPAAKKKEETKEETPTPAPAKKRGRPPKKKTIPCKECGFLVEVGLETCPECGYRVAEEPKIEEPKAEEKPVKKTAKKIEPEIITEPEVIEELEIEKEPEETEEIVTPKIPKKKSHIKASEVFFYIFLIIFFFAGCATAVFLYDKTRENQNKETITNESYKINRTLSCINETNTEEQNYYFDNNKLVKYSMYSVKTYSNNDEVEAEIQNFRDKWGTNGTMRFNKKGYSLEKILIVDLVSTNNITLELGINKNYSYDKVKETMEGNGFVCTSNNTDLGTNLPINTLKNAKVRLENYLEKDNYSSIVNEDTKKAVSYFKTDGDKDITFDIENGTYTEIKKTSNLTIVYNYKTNQEKLTIVEGGVTYEITLNTSNNTSSCTASEWCQKNSDKYIKKEMKEVRDDFNNILKNANVTLSELNRD